MGKLGFIASFHLCDTTYLLVTSAAWICEGTCFSQKGTYKAPHPCVHRLHQKAQVVEYSCNSESLTHAVMCISYLSSAVMTYKSNTIILRDLVMGVESQQHSSTEVVFSPT